MGKSLQGHGREKLPSFIVAGAMRSGTTSLYRYLSEHPEVAVAPTKEVHFFDQRYNLGLDWYGNWFTSAGSAQAIGEATPNYMFEPAAIDRIRSTLPGVKLIISLRNPIERAYSHYWHDRERGKTDQEFSEMVASELRGEDTGPGAYVSRGFYKIQISYILEHFDRGAVHVLFLEELQSDPAGAFGRICRFIGVDDRFAPASLGKRVNPYVTIRSLRLRKLGKRLPKRLGDAIGRVNTQVAAYPSIDPTTRHILRNEYKLANEGLGALLSQDPPDWN